MKMELDSFEEEKRHKKIQKEKKKKENDKSHKQKKYINFKTLSRE